MTQVVIELDETQDRILRHRAAEEKRTPQELCREAVARYLGDPTPENPDRYESFRRMIGLVDDGPTDASVHHDVSLHDLEAPVEDKWKREQKAFRQFLPELLRSHPGEFVAIHEGRVVEAGLDKIDVAQRAYARFGYLPIFISRVVAIPAVPLAR